MKGMLDFCDLMCTYAETPRETLLMVLEVAGLLSLCTVNSKKRWYIRTCRAVRRY